MSVTQSGYPVIPHYGDKRIVKVVVNGVNLAPGVLAGDVATIAKWCAERFNATVAPLVFGECWGYAPRQIRGGTGWSNHASATAWDFNTADFPQGKRRMSATQVAACRAIVKAAGGVLRWGGDYSGSTAVDQQHFEIAPGMADSLALRNLAAKLRTQSTVQEDDMPFTEAQLRSIVRDEVKNALNTLTVDTTDYSVRPPKPRKGRNIPTLLGDVSNFASGAAYNAGQASIASKKALTELQEGMKA